MAVSYRKKYEALLTAFVLEKTMNLDKNRVAPKV